MAQIRPFAAIRYAARPDLDPSQVIAPPYDVLDESDKAELEARHPRNIVRIDLPHMPPKTVGPDACYAQSAATLQEWLAEGTLVRERRPALYPYTQTYALEGRTFRRRGFFALVKLSPFGEGEVVPHEKTYKGPIEDRLKLMHATGAQLSPIFGLYSDPHNEVTTALYGRLGKPMLSGTIDEVRSDLWAEPDAEIENKVIHLMDDRPIYIADGHHRYTTALQYREDARKKAGGTLRPEHPANWCLFVLVGMQDAGLVIRPTHRLIGNLDAFDPDAMKAALGENFEMVAAPLPGGDVARYAREVLPGRPAHTFGLFDGRTRRLFELRLRNLDVLKTLEPGHSDAWRRLDVAILQRYLLDEVIQPKLAGGREPARGYTADPDEIGPRVDGENYQIGLLLQSTPLEVLEELGRTGEVMPQKSTYFFPKLATGMVINPLA